MGNVKEAQLEFGLLFLVKLEVNIPEKMVHLFRENDFLEDHHPLGLKIILHFFHINISSLNSSSNKNYNVL